jgi:DNA polymerase/3'-5' exonuclease PolX
MVFLSKKGYKNKTFKNTKPSIKMIAGSKVKKTKRLRIRPGEPIIITTKPKPRFNEKLIELLERLTKLMTQKGDHIRSRAYSKAQETVMMFNGDITDVEQMKGRPNIGPTILEKFKEYLETGTLRLFEREKDNPEYILSEVYGIGPKKAKELVGKGIVTIAQLRAREDELLNASQKAGLKYYEDILERIPRKEIDEYNMIFQKAFDDVKVPGAEYEIVGSYRRGAQTSGDIDAIITSPDPETFTKFIEKLRNHETGNNIILVTLSYGKTKCLVITKLPGHKYARRVDFMYTSPQEYPFAVLYFTGSKAFNTMMRAHALKMGTSLNEHGLYKKEAGKVKEEKVTHTFGSEHDVFDYLGLEYKSPEERIDGRSIIIVEKPELSEAKREEPQENIRLEPEPVITDAPPVVTVIPQQEPKPKKRITLKLKIKPEKIDIKQSEQVKLTPNSNMTATKQIKEFKTTGIDVLDKLTEKELGDMLIAANDAYYNTKTLSSIK